MNLTHLSLYRARRDSPVPAPAGTHKAGTYDPDPPTPESEILRGFGLVFGDGRSRTWYVGHDGIRRWSDNDQPMDTPVPNRPVPMGDDE